MDDFGIEYYNKEDVEHLLDKIGKIYNCTTDWEGKNYCGFTLDWHYDKGYVDISMPNYIIKALHHLQYKPSTYPQYSPHPHTPIKYGIKGMRQYATSPDTSAYLTPQETTHLQSVVGSFLYYARAVDPTILPALNEIASQQAQPTIRTKAKAQQLMDYMATYPNTYLRYHASNMILNIDSDAAYLVAPKARSRIAGHFQLNSKPKPEYSEEINGAIVVNCTTL